MHPDRQTDRQTNRHIDYNNFATLYRVNISIICEAYIITLKL